MEKGTTLHFTIQNKRIHNSVKTFTCILIAVGFILSCYLLYRHNSLITNTTSAKLDVCSSVFGKGCDGALKSSVLNVFGLSLPAWGALYYLTLIALLGMLSFAVAFFKTEAVIGILLLSFIGVLVSFSLMTLMLTNLTLFCPLCTAIHLINLTLFFLVFKMGGYGSLFQIFNRKPYQSWLLIKHYLKELTGAKIIGYLVLTATIGIFYVDLKLLASPVSSSLNNSINPQGILSEFRSESVKNIPVDNDDAMLGSPGSSVKLVVFSDLTCSGCRNFSHILAGLNKEYKGRICIVFKHFPIGKLCNPAVNEEIHPHACEAALAAEAARLQGKFWSFHDDLFTSNLNNNHTSVRFIAAKLGLDTERFERDRTGEPASIKVKKDIDLAIRLGVNATPAVFLNGRQVNDLRLPALQILIDNQLKQVNPPPG